LVQVNDFHQIQVRSGGTIAAFTFDEEDPTADIWSVCYTLMIGLLIMGTVRWMYQPSLTDSPPSTEEEEEEDWRTSLAQARLEEEAWQREHGDAWNEYMGMDPEQHPSYQGQDDDDDEDVNVFGPSPTTDAEHDPFDDLAQAYREDNVRLALLQEEIDIDTRSHEQVLGSTGQY
jgi:hypothetical protein